MLSSVLNKLEFVLCSVLNNLNVVLGSVLNNIVANFYFIVEFQITLYQYRALYIIENVSNTSFHRYSWLVTI